MEEQLKLIQFLRIKVNELNIQKNNAETEFLDTIKMFDDTFNNVQNLKEKLEKEKYVFNNLIEGKVLKWIGPLSILMLVSIFILLLMIASSNFHIAYYILAAILGGVGFFLISSFITLLLFREITEKHLIKKYPHIKDVYNRVKKLNKDIRLNEKKLIKLREDKDTTKNKFNIILEQFNIKNKELNDAEELYFSILLDKTIITEDKNVFIASGTKKMLIKKN